MALLQIRRGNNGTKGTLQYGEPFFNSTLQTVQFGASGSEEITLVKLNTGIAGINTWGSSSIYENSGSLSVTGNITASNAYFRGDVTISGSLKLGDSNIDTVTVVADFGSDLIPDQSASYNLGTALKYWNTAYLGSISLAALAGVDAPNNIIFVNAANQLTASNDFEYIEGQKLRLGSGSEDRFWVEPNTGNTFASGNLYVSGTTGIILKSNISSSGGNLSAVSGVFANLNPSWNPSAADNGLVFTQGGSLVNTSKIRYFEAQEQLNIGNGKFIIDGTNGNTFTSGTLHALGQISGSSAVLTQTLQVDGATTLNNQLSVLGVNGRININQDLRADGSGSFGNGITVTGSVVLNAGGGGFVHVSGNTQLGNSPQTSELSISGSVNHLFTGTALQNVFRRYSAVKSSSIIFDDDNSVQVPGLGPNLGKILIRQQSVDGLLDSHITTNVTSSGIVLSGPGGVGSIRVGYANVNTASSIKVEFAATDGILLNSRTQLASNLSVTGSTILAGGLITTASNILITGVGANQGNIQNFNTASFGLVNVSSSLYVTGSTTILGELKIGDLTTSASGLIEGSASIAGDLTVRGNAVYLGVDRFSTDANLIEIGSGSTIPSQVEGAGLFISGASAQFVYREVGDRMFLNKSLKIEGDQVSGFGLQVSASTYLSGNLEVSGNLDVYGNINLGNVTITNTASIQELVVNNNISGGNNLNLANNASISGNLYVFGTETVNGQLKANSATALHSTLNVSGAVGLNNVLRVTGSTAITGGLFVSGNTELSSSLTVKEYSFFEKNMRVSGNLQVDGNLEILGDVTQLQVSNLQIEDKNIILASGSLSSLQSDDAGLTILGPTTPIQFTWDHTNQRMNLNKDFNVETNLLVAGDNIIDTAVALAIALG